MRPKNNFALTWEELTFHGAGGKEQVQPRPAREREQRNQNTPRRDRAARRITCSRSARRIRVDSSSPNPATGKANKDIRKQWKRLLSIAERMLGCKLTGKRSELFNFRHSGASHIAARARD